ncbi:MAG: rhodanese-like domain-containing protein [Ilumatobacteraceae bacterium]
MSIREVTVDELEVALASAGGRVIDVREEHEYTEGHVPGAVLIALSTVAEHVDAFRSDPAPYVICRSGARSMQACQHLADQGIEAVNVAGGTMAWMMSGRAVVSGDQPS